MELQAVFRYFSENKGRKDEIEYKLFLDELTSYKPDEEKLNKLKDGISSFF